MATIATDRERAGGRRWSSCSGSAVFLNYVDRGAIGDRRAGAEGASSA